MMKKFCCALLALAMAAALPLMAADKKLGKGVKIKTATPIKEILANPDHYLGKEVMVEGEMIKVCQEAGCWTLVRDSSSEEPIIAKVPDGVIVFPKDGAGKKIAVQGTLQKMSKAVQIESEIAATYGIACTGAVVK